MDLLYLSLPTNHSLRFWGWIAEVMIVGMKRGHRASHPGLLGAIAVSSDVIQVTPEDLLSLLFTS